MNEPVQAVVDQPMAVEPSWSPTAGIPSPEAGQEGLLLVGAVASSSKLLWFAKWLLVLSHLSCILPCSSHAKCHVLSLASWCPSAGTATISTLRTVCRAFPKPEGHREQQFSSSCSVLGMACQSEEVQKSTEGTGLLVLCGHGEDTGWRCSGGLRKWLVPRVSDGEEMGVRYHHILSVIVVVNIMVYHGARCQYLLQKGLLFGVRWQVK